MWLTLEQPDLAQEQPAFLRSVRAGIVLRDPGELARSERQVLILEREPGALQLTPSNLLRAPIR